MNIPSLGLFCALAFGLSSCSTYRPAPVDLQRDNHDWLQLSQQLIKNKQQLQLDELKKIGLLLNPELNIQRLNYAKSTKVAEFAGLWDDPSIGAELARNITGNISNYALAPSLSLPITGLPNIAKQIAMQYKESDYWTMRAAEVDYLAALEGICVEFLLNQRVEGLISQRLSQLRGEMSKVDELNQLGEIDFAEKQIAQQRLSELITEQQNAQDETLNSKLELTQRLGLHPQSHYQVNDHLLHMPARLIARPSPESLLALPRLKASMAQYELSELELKLEIRKQYPELNLSPGFKHDGGEDEIGLGIELNIPLWNRNREAIARTTAQRSLQMQSYINIWRDLLSQAHALDKQSQLSAKHCRSEMVRLAQLRESLQQQEKLYQMGELEITQISEMRHEVFLRELSYLEHLGQLLQTQAKLNYMNPFKKLL